MRQGPTCPQRWWTPPRHPLPPRRASPGLELGFASKPNLALSVRPGVRRWCRERGRRRLLLSAGRLEQGQRRSPAASRPYPAPGQPGVLGERLAGVSPPPKPLLFWKRTPLPCSRRVWAATDRVPVCKDLGERRRMPGSGRAAAERRGLPSGLPSGCWELLPLASLNVPFRRALSVEAAIFSLIVSPAEVTHRLLTHSLLL